MNVGELFWIGVLHRPEAFSVYNQRKHDLGSPLRLAYLHGRPLIYGRLLFPEDFSNIGFPVESGDNVESTGLMDPQGWGSVSDVPTFAAYRHLQDLRVPVVVVAGWTEFEGDSPLFGERGEGGQKAVLLQQMLFRKGERCPPIE